MEEGLVALQAVGDWGPLECQRHICEIQGTAGCRVQGSGCRVQGAGFRVQGAGCRVQGSGFRVRLDRESGGLGAS